MTVRELMHFLAHCDGRRQLRVMGGEQNTITDIKQICTRGDEMDFSKKGAILLVLGTGEAYGDRVVVPPLPALPPPEPASIFEAVVRKLLG